MPFSLSSLFKKKSGANADGLKQAEREAIADVLHYCLYADNFIALAETKLISDAFSAINWDPSTSFESYEAASIARAREAKEDKDAREDFYKSIQARLGSKHAKTLALDLCHQLFLADGMESSKEAELEAKLKKILG